MGNPFERGGLNRQPSRKLTKSVFDFGRAYDWAENGIPPEVQQAAQAHKTHQPKPQQWSFNEVMERARRMSAESAAAKGSKDEL